MQPISYFRVGSDCFPFAAVKVKFQCFAGRLFLSLHSLLLPSQVLLCRPPSSVWLLRLRSLLCTVPLFPSLAHISLPPPQSIHTKPSRWEAELRLSPTKQVLGSISAPQQGWEPISAAANHGALLLLIPLERHQCQQPGVPHSWHPRWKLSPG